MFLTARCLRVAPNPKTLLATASGALAVTKTHNVDPSHPASTNVYNPFGAYVGTAPDIIVRLWEREN